MKKNLFLTGFIVLLLAGCVTTEKTPSARLDRMYNDGELTKQEFDHFQMKPVDRYQNMVLAPTN